MFPRAQPSLNDSTVICINVELISGVTQLVLIVILSLYHEFGPVSNTKNEAQTMFKPIGKAIPMFFVKLIPTTCNKPLIPTNLSAGSLC